MEAGETVSRLADEVGISRQRLYEWRDSSQASLSEVTVGPAGRPDRQQELTGLTAPECSRGAGTSGKGTDQGQASGELEQKVGQQQLDLDFFAKPCGISRKISVGAALLAKRDLQSHRKMTTGMSHGEFNIDRMCWLAGVSRASYYRHRLDSAPRRDQTGCAFSFRSWLSATHTTATAGLEPL
ncbi:hypothetical protein [Mesorhizobium sp.]|uniref:hypothetical protein n=1 Tax=Mesorhizobium sp. TaxID=1871066 RepID=UPI000FE8BB3F|nr:hypothetical protein [Mesorhizobium sp.]RWO32509.1 MAG: hypothetical protein EOS08_08940 [Mesorhizobium sp.]RWQ47644.1 MAG: hypothetical protein EOS83_27170 [Mesorhizobium sp.]TIQ05348.1 MAG: hypothetical protein E5X57_28110 [Mesorhizobium sp.]